MLCAIVCCVLQGCVAHPILFSIWSLAPASRSQFMLMYRDAVTCGEHVECPQFTPDLHKFDQEYPSESTVYPDWTRESMQANRRVARIMLQFSQHLSRCIQCHIF